MPVFLRPDKTFKFSFKRDADIPAAKRPHFLARYFKESEYRDICQQIDAIRGTKTFFADRDALIRRVVAGVVNMEGHDSIETVLPELTNDEKWQLLWGILGEQHMTEDDAKNSGSP